MMTEGEIFNYLRARFPGVDAKVFYTDYAGDIHSNVIGGDVIAQWLEVFRSCQECQGVCKLSESVRASACQARIKVKKSPRGYEFLDVRAMPGVKCRFENNEEKFSGMFRESGLTERQRGMTFENYSCGDNPELKFAVREAFLAAKNQKNLIIAGKYGTGKTHLAVAIAIARMKKGEQAVFRLTSSLLDEIRETAWKNYIGYFDLMKKFKAVPCLVLDDLGKEKNSQAGMDYLHQIIDYRYCNGLQTIITTQAACFDDLCQSRGIDFVAPIISRVLENGSWVTIKNADEYRLKKGREKNAI